MRKPKAVEGWAIVRAGDGLADPHGWLFLPSEKKPVTLGTEEAIHVRVVPSSPRKRKVKRKEGSAK